MGAETAIAPSRGPLRGEIRVPGDKSISHRAVMIGAACRGTTVISGYGPGADNTSTRDVFRALGVSITQEGDRLEVTGVEELTAPDDPLDCGNSGTTMRLLTGLLLGADRSATLIGDASLSARPMGRVAEPLNQLGANVKLHGDGGCPPIEIVSRRTFAGGRYDSPIASAQVKSCMLLAAFMAGKAMTVTEPGPSRDHTEVMLRYLGVDVQSSEHYTHPATAGRATVSLPAAAERPAARPITVPGDISSAAFLMVAAAIIPGSDVVLRCCGWSETRIGIAEVLRSANVTFETMPLADVPGDEPAADIRIRAGELVPFSVEASQVPRLVDEIPVLAVLASRIAGVSRFEGIGELRVKESDRLERTVALLQACGCVVRFGDDWLEVVGRPDKPLTGFTFDAHHDHRMAAAAIVAAKVADGPCHIVGLDSLDISYPHLVSDLQGLETT